MRTFISLLSIYAIVCMTSVTAKAPPGHEAAQVSKIMSSPISPAIEIYAGIQNLEATVIESPELPIRNYEHVASPELAGYVAPHVERVQAFWARSSC